MKKYLNKKTIIIACILLLLVVGIIILTCNPKNEDKKTANKKEEKVVKIEQKEVGNFYFTESMISKEDDKAIFQVEIKNKTDQDQYIGTVEVNFKEDDKIVYTSYIVVYTDINVGTSFVSTIDYLGDYSNVNDVEYIINEDKIEIENE